MRWALQTHGRSALSALPALAGLVALFTSIAPASTFKYVSADGVYGAQAQFDLKQAANDFDLQVTFTNIATVRPTQNPQVLTGVFFNLSQGGVANPLLTPLSAVMSSGSGLFTSSNTWDPHADVSGFWAFDNGVQARGVSYGYGISSAGLGIFSKKDTFAKDGIDLDGVGYGLAPSIYSPVGDSLSGTPLVRDTMVFRFGGVTANAINVSHVEFQWGSSTSEMEADGYAAVPEPSPAVLMGGGLLLIGLGSAIRRRLRAR